MYKHGIVTLRIAHRDDLLSLLELKNESWMGTHRVSIQTMEKQVNWWESTSRSKNDYIMIACIDDRPVGVYKITNIDWINGVGDSAHDVFSTERGKGYSYPVLAAGVSFAFNLLNLRRLNTEVLVGNHSKKAALKVGFIVEGMRRQLKMLNGNTVDSEVFGLLREECNEL